MIPFADYLSLTTPIEHKEPVRADLEPVLDAAGGHVGMSDERCTIYRLDAGTVKLQSWGSSVLMVSASGSAIAQLRRSGVYGEYLAALAPYPHRVSRLDSALDLVADSPRVIRAVWLRASKGRVALSRKRVPGSNCSKHIAPGIDGRETGTVYIGAPTAKVRAVVYDKRQEIFARTGDDVGARLRFEIRVKAEIGATLADASDPARLFWHYASPDLLEAPPGVQPWASHAEGFSMPERQTFTAAQLMDRKLESSADVRRLLELADQMGPLGVDWLCQKLRKLARRPVEGAPGRLSGAEAALGRLPPTH